MECHEQQPHIPRCIHAGQGARAPYEGIKEVRRPIRGIAGDGDVPGRGCNCGMGHAVTAWAPAACAAITRHVLLNRSSSWWSSQCLRECVRPPDRSTLSCLGTLKEGGRGW